MKNKIYVLVGLPASGKSTWASRQADCKIVSSDAIREELYGDESIQKEPFKVFNLMNKRTKNLLAEGYNVVYDATNLSIKKRKHLINNELSGFDIEKVAVVFATPYKECLKRNANRDRKVPEYVIERMYKSFQFPHYDEGFDTIEIIKSDNKFVINIEDIIMLVGMDHDTNPKYHTESVGTHMLECHEYFTNKYKEINDTALETAILYHDIGKRDCKSFIDSKGKPSEYAHYYSHENVSSYLCMFLKGLTKEELIDCCMLVNKHMMLHNCNSEERVQATCSKRSWERLKIMYECDKAGSIGNKEE